MQIFLAGVYYDPGSGVQMLSNGDTRIVFYPKGYKPFNKFYQISSSTSSILELRLSIFAHQDQKTPFKKVIQQFILEN